MSKPTVTKVNKAPNKSPAKKITATEPAKKEDVVTPAIPENKDETAPSTPAPKDTNPKTEDQKIIEAKALVAADEAAKKASDQVMEEFEKKKNKTLFVSPHKDCYQVIRANGKEYRPTFDNSKTLVIWSVDNKDAESFGKHMLCQHGKIKKTI